MTGCEAGIHSNNLASFFRDDILTINWLGFFYTQILQVLSVNFLSHCYTHDASEKTQMTHSDIIVSMLK